MSKKKELAEEVLKDIPIEVVTRIIHTQLRIIEISKAIMVHLNVPSKIPFEWLVERNDLMGKAKK